MSSDETVSPSVRSVWHLGITVSDIERSIAFYTEALGLELRHSQEQHNPYTAKLVGYEDANLRIAQLRFPGPPITRSDHSVELVQYLYPRGEPGTRETRHPGTAHVAFEVADIFGACAAVERLGGTLVSEPQKITAGINEGGFAVYFRDPDGFTLEFIQPRQ